MPVHLYALLTWTTLRRLPLIHPGATGFLRRLLPEIARRHATRILGIGIVRNHVHLVRELPAQVDVPRLVQGLKGASARIANRDGVMPRAKLQWATGYDVRSLGIRDVRRAIRYVRGQDQRHPDMALALPRAESPGSA
jgi:REP element-mobilizing transposase RayT